MAQSLHSSSNTSTTPDELVEVCLGTLRHARYILEVQHEKLTQATKLVEKAMKEHDELSHTEQEYKNVHDKLTDFHTQIQNIKKELDPKVAEIVALQQQLGVNASQLRQRDKKQAILFGMQTQAKQALSKQERDDLDVRCQLAEENLMLFRKQQLVDDKLQRIKNKQSALRDLQEHRQRLLEEKKALLAAYEQSRNTNLQCYSDCRHLLKAPLPDENEPQFEGKKSKIKMSDADIKQLVKIADLERGLAQVTAEKAKQEERVKALTPLADVGAKIRIRYFEHFKAPGNDDLIEAGDAASHHGDAVADACLFLQNPGSMQGNEQSFRDMYFLSPEDVLKNQHNKELVQMLSWRGSMKEFRQRKKVPAFESSYFQDAFKKLWAMMKDQNGAVLGNVLAHEEPRKLCREMENEYVRAYERHKEYRKSLKQKGTGFSRALATRKSEITEGSG